MIHYKKRAYYYCFLLSIISFFLHGISFASEFDQIKKIETYLNSIQSFEADILQIDPYGNETFGTIKLKKPGKLRIEYNDPKADHLILASNGVLVVIDYKSNTEPLRYPISETPLKYLSNQNLDLQDQSIDFKISASENNVVLELEEMKRIRPDNLLSISKHLDRTAGLTNKSEVFDYLIFFQRSYLYYWLGNPY